MKAPLPPDFKPPFWGTKDFRRLVLGGVLGLAVLGVLVFDIGPMLNSRPARVKKSDPNAFVPQPALAGQPREVKFEGVPDKAKDGTSIDDQDEPYQYLVRCLARMDAAQLSKDAKSVDYPYYSKMPVELRGQTVKILALFLKSSPIRVDAAPGGVNFIHRTYLSDLSGSEGYVVDLLEPPAEDLASRSLVGMDAVFLKLGTYEGKKGPVQAPLFLGKSLHLVKERMAADSVANVPGWVVVSVAAGSMVVMLLITARMFRKSKPAAPKGPALSLETLKS
jgi:hypothetical protein